MLTFLTGTYFSAKKSYIYTEICRLLENGKKVYLIVPEQSSFDRDRDFLFSFGERLGNMLTVTSFTHLSRDVLEENGLHTKPEADEAARSVIMSLAVEECKDSLDVYRKYSMRPMLVQRLLTEYAEIKQAGIETDELLSVSERLSSCSLKEKTGELARIFSADEALITHRFSDATDNIRVMTDFLKENRIFKDSYVFFDDFRGFTGAQIKLISEIIAQAQESCISVFAPDSVNAYDSEAFRHAVSNCRKLRGAATLKGVSCTEKKICEKHPVGAIAALSDSLFCAEREIYKEQTDAVTIMSSENVYSECDAVALEIKKLLENGKRCKDIAVYDRDGSYAKTLTAALRKQNIPVFEDKRVSLFEYPLVRMLLSAVSVAAYGFSTEQIFNFIKTGVAGISPEECAMLENYAYIWQIDKGMWLRPFASHPDGYGEKETDEAALRLEKINEIRSRVITPLTALKMKLDRASGAVSCRALFEFLVAVNASENFRDYAVYLYENGEEATALGCSAVWDTVTQSIDALHEAISGREVTASRLCELLKIIFSSVDIGRIPAGIDEIVIGQAGRTRHLEPKVVFVLGCNDGIFPATPRSGGLFTPDEKRTLCSNGLVLENISENIYAEERMIAYSVLVGGTEKLYVSYSRTSPDGANLESSEIIKEIKYIVPDCCMIDDRQMSSLDRIGSLQSAFEECASHFNDNTPYSESLREFVKEALPAEYEAVKKAAENAPFVLNNKNTAVELFSKDMYISPSKAETFYSCAFRYFCQYGLKLKKLRPADLDARINGLLIHHVLEKVLLSGNNKRLTEMSQDELKAQIDEITEGFVKEFMGGREGKSILLNRSIDKAKDTAWQILKRMIKEFAVSRFETVAVELEIAQGNPVEPYRITLPDGGSITVSGKVDRVDVYENEGKAYVRVVDYKTGGKDFRLGDVFAGLNMQMLIYLMCIWDSDCDEFRNPVPAGIMYVPANNSGKLLDRNATADEVEAQRLANGRMNGMVLEDEDIIDAMEEGAAGTFINASIDEKGRLKGTLLSYDGFRLLHKKIDSMLEKMGVALHNGEISAVPVMGTSSYNTTCTYCDFKDVCRRNETDDIRELKTLKHPEAVMLLKESENDG